MLKNTINFIKYNNLTVFIILGFFIVGASVFAQTEAGQEFIGGEETSIIGVDNTLLLGADLDSFNMNFKIERIEKDSKYYYVTYTYEDLVLVDNAWQYEVRENIRKISLKLRRDLGEYLAEELYEQYEARLKELKQEKEKQEEEGNEMRFEVVEYTGLVGQTLGLVEKVFPGYEAVKRREIPTPTIPNNILLSSETDISYTPVQGADDLEEIYNDYIAEKDPDGDDVFGLADNCPNDFNHLQEDIDEDGIGDACDLVNDLEVDTGATSTDEVATITDEIAEEEVIEEPTSAEGSGVAMEEPDVEIIDIVEEEVVEEAPIEEVIEEPASAEGSGVAMEEPVEEVIEE